MSDGHKDDFGGADDRFAQLGQQAGTVLGQLFAAAEQFGQQVSRDSQSWSESGRHDPFVSALRQASEEFRATANRAAENLSESFRQPTDSDTDPASATGADSPGAGATGNVRKIGGGRLDSTGVGAADRASAAVHPDTRSASGAATDIATHDQRVAELADIFTADDKLAQLSDEEFDALKILLGKHYRAIREFQSR